MVPNMASLNFRPLHPHIGAEVQGVDLGGSVDEETFEAIQAEWIRRGILLFRGQTEMTLEQHIAFSRRLGELEVFTLRQYTHPDHPVIFVISNLIEGGKAVGARVERIWHSDSQFLACPSTGSILHAKEVPNVGADTLFASSRAVYEALDPAMRARIDKLQVSHSRIRAYPITYPKRPPLTEEEKTRTPDVIHPMVRTHPVTVTKALYIGRSTAPEIVGWPKADSDALIDELLDFATSEQFVYRHKWQVGDAVLWDNRSTMHCATDYDEDNERRLMYRTTIVGERPF